MPEIMVEVDTSSETTIAKPIVNVSEQEKDDTNVMAGAKTRTKNTEAILPPPQSKPPVSEETIPKSEEGRDVTPTIQETKPNPPPTPTNPKP